MISSRTPKSNFSKKGRKSGAKNPGGLTKQKTQSKNQELQK